MSNQKQITIYKVYHYTPSLQNSSLNSVISFSKTGVGIAPKKSNNRNKFCFLIQTGSWPIHLEDNKRHRTAHNVQDQ